MVIQAKRIVVRGRVQGVGFRYFVQDTGTRLGLTGDVRNCWDSTVEINVEGNARGIVEFIKEVQKGPALARVARLDVLEVSPSGKYHSFTVEGM